MLTSPGFVAGEHHSAAVADVDAVVASMHDDLLAYRRARFATVHGGGTLRAEIPLLFRRLGSEESL